MGRIAKALGLQMRTEVEMGATCLEDRDGKPLMSRTDPATGRPLGFDRRGFDGRGTADETRAKALRGRRQ